MIKLITRCIHALRRRIIWFFCRLLPVDNKKIVISSFYGRGYGDNSKYIVEKLLKTGKYFRIIWLVQDENEKNTLPDKVEACKIYSTRCIYHLMTAKVWIDNCRKPIILDKRKKQFYIQTWHGFALKRIEKDVVEKLADNYAKFAEKDSKNIDCIISCSKFMSDIYRKSFWYNGEIYEIGAPRNDVLLKNDINIKDKVHKYFSLKDSRKLVLYAPTFRADTNMEVYNIDYIRVKKACEKNFGGEFTIITRLHPNIAKKSKSIQFDNQNIVNGSFYPDIQELMAACDIIITDYSSVMFDFGLTFKPCFQFAVDIDDYKNDRDFYFEIDKLPFPLATNNDELEKNILDFDGVKYKEELESFYNKVGMLRDGNASEKCAELIIEKCYEKEK